MGCGGGVGQTWYDAGMIVDPNIPNTVILTMIDVSRSTNNGDTFTNLTNGYCGGSVVNVDQHGRAFLGGYSDVLPVSGDGGATLASPGVVGGTHRIWETIVGGRPSNTWYTNSPDNTKGTLDDRSTINQLQFAVIDKTIVIVGSNDGNVHYGFDLGQGVSESATWLDVIGGNAVLPNRPVLDVASNRVEALVGYADIEIYVVVCSAGSEDLVSVTITSDLDNGVTSSVDLTSTRDLYDLFLPIIKNHGKLNRRRGIGINWSLFPESPTSNRNSLVSHLW